MIFSVALDFLSKKNLKTFILEVKYEIRNDKTYNVRRKRKCYPFVEAIKS